MIRLFVPDALAAGAAIRPTAEQAHYLCGVMRRGVGDEVLLFNGRNGECRAAIGAVSKRGCELNVLEQIREQTPAPDLELIVALVKRARLETIVEKAAELGVGRVRLVITRFTGADHTNVARLQAIAVEASEQTGRLDVPEVVAPVKLDRLLADWKPPHWLLFCDEAGDARPIVLALAEPAPVAVLIGPEGGFALEERERLRASRFVIPVSLGPRILRADTAAISALALVQAAIGDWR
jgi:16S rRNA (uracil1498-N3)-methyltransferase